MPHPISAIKENERFVSYAQNFEDVMLWRALKDVDKGFYIDVGAFHPEIDSVSKSFYDRGWRGVNVEPTGYYADLLRRERPGDLVLEVVLSDKSGLTAFYNLENPGLNTADPAIADRHRKSGLGIIETTLPCLTLEDIFNKTGGMDINWLKIDAEGFESRILKGWGKSAARPWIVVVESTVPNEKTENFELWENELLSRGYSFVFFDGLNRYYIYKKYTELKKFFDCGPNVFDDFVLSGTASNPLCSVVNSKLAKEKSEKEKTEAEISVLNRNLAEKENRNGELMAEAESLRAEIESLRVDINGFSHSRSWQITEPLRFIAKLLRIIRLKLSRGANNGELRQNYRNANYYSADSGCIPPADIDDLPAGTRSIYADLKRTIESKESKRRD